ncbi:MAG TPA: hypothetical protein VFS25_14320 [Chitinophaga sp.]|uniref:hypothetical protein n=1 Tax=Chitinophaga sp. TaxID=1869181 RepID=UPI002DBF775D|nr:hypothetical protein [Chitinophaga sp.]HEU4554014.1 hypothetical protein [Chitinophaga sp.]
MNRIILTGGFLLLLACNTAPANNSTGKTPAVIQTTATDAADTTAAGFWTAFQQALQQKDDHALIALTHFPLPGVKPFLNADIPIAATGADTAQFLAALPEILNKALGVQALNVSWDSLWIIAPADFEQQITGGQKLLSIIDPGTQLRLCYTQWAEGSDKETNQALVFSKVNGEYKLCGIAWRGVID